MKNQTPRYVFVPEGTGTDNHDCVKCCFNRKKGDTCARPVTLHSCLSSSLAGPNPTGKNGWYIDTRPKAVKLKTVEHIKLQSLPGFDGTVMFRICAQTPDVYDYFVNQVRSNAFAARSGIYIQNAFYPQFDEDVDNKVTILYTRGPNTHRDNNAMFTRRDMYKRVVSAVKEFNRFLTKQNLKNKKV